MCNSRKAAAWPGASAALPAASGSSPAARIASGRAVPDASRAVATQSAPAIPASVWLPSMPPKRPSSSAVATTSTGAGGGDPGIAERAHAFQPDRDAERSVIGPALRHGIEVRARSRIAGPPSGPKRPKTLPTASRRTASPWRFISAANQSRTAMSAGEYPTRSNPPVTGSRPKALMPSSKAAKAVRVDRWHGVFSVHCGRAAGDKTRFIAAFAPLGVVPHRGRRARLEWMITGRQTDETPR